MKNRYDRLLFFWVPILVVYLYIFNLILGIGLVKKFFSTLPVWGWLLVYFAVMFIIKYYLKSIGPDDDEKIDYTAKNLKVNSDIILIFLFSVISFALVMYLLGSSLESALIWK